MSTIVELLSAGPGVPVSPVDPLRLAVAAYPPRRPRTTMRYHRARNNLDRHPNYFLAAYMASGT